MENYISYKTIEGEYENSWDIPYEVLLKTTEWINFRKFIIDRDKNICTICKKTKSENIRGKYYRKPNQEEIAESLKTIDIDVFGDGKEIWKMKKATIVAVPDDNPTILHVHHTFYVFGNLPWEYNTEALITVCHTCHNDIHNSQIIPVYTNSNLLESLNLTPCGRCNGTGYISKFHYFHDGICFSCDGRKYEEFSSF
jgi:hypothetical protein